jgi:hypothetical protein
MTHAEHIEDPNSGDLIDVNYYCSGQCYTLSTGGDAYGHAYPGGSETDYDVMCHHCGTLLWRGISTPCSCCGSTATGSNYCPACQECNGDCPADGPFCQECGSAAMIDGTCGTCGS